MKMKDIVNTLNIDGLREVPNEVQEQLNVLMLKYAS